MAIKQSTVTTARVPEPPSERRLSSSRPHALSRSDPTLVTRTSGSDGGSFRGSGMARRQEPSASPSFLIPDEVAEILRTTRTAIYAMNGRGQLPGATRIGRRLLFRRDVLLSWLDQKRTPSPKQQRR